MSEPTTFSPAGTMEANGTKRRGLPSHAVVDRPKASAPAPDVALLSNDSRPVTASAPASAMTSISCR